MSIQAVSKSGTIYASKMFKGVKYERIKKVLPDGNVFITMKEVKPNGDMDTYTKLNGNIVSSVKRYVHRSSDNKKLVVTKVFQNFSNGKEIETTKYEAPLRQDVLTYVAKDGFEIIPVKREFPTKEITIVRHSNLDDIFKHLIMSGRVSKSSVGTASHFNYYDKYLNKIKETGFLKTNLWEEQGKIKPYEICDRYVK